MTVAGRQADFKEYKGSYIIQKNGKVILKNEFTALKMNNGISLNIKIAKDLGNSLYYTFKTETYEWQGEDIKPKNTKNIENIILSGILIYAQTEEEE